MLSEEREKEIREYRHGTKRDDQINELLAEIDRLRAENELLRTEFEQWKKQYINEWAKVTWTEMQTENARYREALEKIEEILGK